MEIDRTATLTASNHDVDDLLNSIQALWPSGRFSEPQLKASIWRRIQPFTPQEVQQALVYVREQDPDATRPSWKAFFQWLHRHSSTVSAKNPFYVFLTNLRKIWREDGYRNAYELSDSEVWDKYVYANTYPILYNTLSGEKHVDEGGRREKLAQVHAQSLCREWLQRFDESGELPPEFLRA